MAKAYFLLELLSSPSEVGEYIDQIFILVSWTTKPNSTDLCTQELPKPFHLFPVMEMLCRWSHIPQAPSPRGPGQIPRSIVEGWLTLPSSGDQCVTKGRCHLQRWVDNCWWQPKNHQRIPWAASGVPTTAWKLSQGEQGLNTGENSLFFCHEGNGRTCWGKLGSCHHQSCIQGWARRSSVNNGTSPETMQRMGSMTHQQPFPTKTGHWSKASFTLEWKASGNLLRKTYFRGNSLHLSHSEEN